MTRPCSSRRAFGLVIVLVVMTVVAGLLTILSAQAASSYRLHRQERVRSVATALADSAVAYVQHQRNTWRVQWPAQPIVLDVHDLLVNDCTGSVVLEFDMPSGRRVCRVVARSASGNCEMVEERQVTFSSTRP